MRRGATLPLAPRRHPVVTFATMRSTLSDTFWILILAVVVLFAFFVALGAFSLGEVAWLSVTILGLALAYTVHAIWVSRHREARDPAAMRDRERRGF
jgi:fatty acid desaturase